MTKLGAYLIVALVLVSLAHAQINFSTGWGKRSVHHHHAAAETAKPEKTAIPDETLLTVNSNEQDAFDRCRSLVKSLGLINLITQVSSSSTDR